MLAQTKKDPYVFEPHEFYHDKNVGKHVCRFCGLLALGNRFSQWARKKGCRSDDHPDFNRMRKKFTGLKRKVG